MSDDNVTSDAVIDEQKPAEKMLSQSEVNAIVGREKQAAAERARREAEAQYRAQMEQQQAQAQPQAAIGQPQGQQAQASGVQAPSNVDVDAIFQQLQERLNKEREQKMLEDEMTRAADSYFAHMKRGSELYDDFGDVTKDFDPTAFPQITYLVANLQNGADIFYELAKNPSKLVTLETMAQRSPQMARSQLMKMGESITQNRAALAEAGEQATDAPLDRLQPSRATQGSNGELSIRDLRSQPWLRV